MNLLGPNKNNQFYAKTPSEAAISDKRNKLFHKIFF